VKTVKKAKKATPPVRDYLQEDLLALVPDYKSGYKSTVITKKGSYPDSRAVTWLTKMIARYYCLDYSLMKKRGRSILNQRSNISLAFTASLVLIPVKLNVAKSENELATGYISLKEIEDIVTGPAGSGRKGFWLSKVIFKNGKQLATLNTRSTLRERERRGNKVLRDYQQRKEDNNRSKPIKTGEMMKNTAKCDCPLSEIFLGKHAIELVMENLLQKDANLEGYSQKTREFLELLRSGSRGNN